MKQLILSALCIHGFALSCRQADPEPVKPTVFSVQVLYDKTRQPVDSARVTVIGTKGTYWTGRDFQTFLDAYTDKQGRIQSRLMLPRDYFITYTVGKLVIVGNRASAYSVVSSQPTSEVLKHEQDNTIVVALDTL